MSEDDRFVSVKVINEWEDTPEQDQAVKIVCFDVYKGSTLADLHLRINQKFAIEGFETKVSYVS